MAPKHINNYQYKTRQETNLLENLPEGSIILMFSSGLTSFQGVGLLFVQTTFTPTVR